MLKKCLSDSVFGSTSLTLSSVIVTQAPIDFPSPLPYGRVPFTIQHLKWCSNTPKSQGDFVKVDPWRAEEQLCTLNGQIWSKMHYYPCIMCDLNIKLFISSGGRSFQILHLSKSTRNAKENPAFKILQKSKCTESIKSQSQNGCETLV